MSWKSIESGLRSVARGVEHVAEEGLEEVEHAAARVAAKVVSARPFEVALPKLSDEADLFLESHAGYDFPHEVTPPTGLDHPALVTGKPTPVVPPAGFRLNSKSPEGSFGLHLDAPGDAELSLSAAGPGTDWGKKGAESAVMSVYVDGKYQQDVVLWGGAKATSYDLTLGDLPKGDHTVTLRYAAGKSARGAKGITVSAGTASPVQYPNREAEWAAQNAPVLVGRHGGLENNHTDTPLAMFHRISKGRDGTTTISYGYVFSNEDTGDGGQPALEQALWGRLTDLETVFRVKLDPNGQVLSRSYEGVAHHWHPFGGKFEGTHPVIRTCTDNNNVSDSGDGPLHFMFPADHLVSDAPTGELMRENPAWFEAEGAELHREGKIDPNGLGTDPLGGIWGQVESVLADLKLEHKPQVADPRDYLYVQLHAEEAHADPLVARVTLKNGKQVDSDLGVEDAAIGRNDWSQTTVRLPPGTTAKDIASVRFVSKNGEARVDRVGHVYLLDQAYQPVELPAARIER